MDRGYTHRAFAGPVKQFAVTAINNIWYDKAQAIGHPKGWEEFTLDDLAKDKAFYRPLLQFIGEYGRKVFGEDVWVEIFAKQPIEGPIVVDDVRHHNEVKWLKDNGFLVVRVERNEKQRVESIKAAFEQAHDRPMKKKDLKAMMGHESEIHVPDLDVHEVVWNTSLADLEDVAQGWARFSQVPF